MDRTEDITKSCINCCKAKIEYWDDRYNYYCTFECPHKHRNTGVIIPFLEKHNCVDFMEKDFEVDEPP